VSLPPGLRFGWIEAKASLAMKDEQQIREVITTWQQATAAGDLDTVLKLMAEDVVFLIPGMPPMRGRDGFAAGFRKATQQFRIDSHSEVKEIHVSGDWAYCWNSLHVTMVPLLGGNKIRRSGSTLTVLRKDVGGNWVVFRDANMLVPEPSVG
jgi:uncharacterized protein (TIGR02246 family)